jgi:hypothetical protein
MTALGIYVVFGIPAIAIALALIALYATRRAAEREDQRAKSR